MLKVKREGVILEKTKNYFENQSVLNPAVWQDGKNTHIIYRTIDKNYMSYLGYARAEGPTKIVERWDKPFLVPKYKYECKGIEDPRIVKIGDTFYLVYVVHDGKNALLAYSYGKDLFKLKSGGVISPKVPYSKAAQLFKHSQLKDQYYFFASYYAENAGKNVLIWDKDGFIFPEKINGKYALVHRFFPDIQIAYFDNFSQLKDRYFWIDYLMNLSKYVMLEGTHGFEARHIGGGAPPVKTKDGWLMIYHASDEVNDGRTYRAAAALFDLKNPQKLIAKLPYPIISPEKDYELRGHVSEVTFPSGTTVFNDKLYMYYGAADSHIAVASIGINSLVKELLKFKIKAKRK